MKNAPEAGSRQVPVQRYGDSGRADVDDVAVEEPVLIQLAWPGGQQAVSVTMRTPGHDAELAVGFLYGEGILPLATPVLAVHVVAAGDHESGEGSTVTVELGARPDVDALNEQRNFFMTSSCGVCGKASLDAVRTHSQFMGIASPLQISAAELRKLPSALLAKQELFAGTGSIHAAGVFTAGGLQGAVYEDVGRHNALDKLIGAAFMDERLPLTNAGIIVSGRASFELVQKASMAGCGMLAAVGAPSSLAIQLAWEVDMTLIGFVRSDRFNVYSVPGRVLDLS